MNAKDLFGVVVRVFGLILLVWGLWNILYGVAKVIGIFSSPQYETVTFFWSGIPSSLLGVYFLSGAPQLLRFCYPESDSKT